MVYNVLYSIRMCMYIITIPLLIISIITKNKCINKNNLKISIFMLIYLISELFLINELVNIGLEILLYLILSIIASIILIISIIINKKKISKNNEEHSNYFLKNYSKIFILPIVLIIAIVFLYDLFIINNANLIMVYVNRSNMFASDPVQISVSNNDVREFSLKHELITKNKKEDKFLYYYFKDDDYQGISLDSSEDPGLRKIDMNIVSKIYKDILSKNNNDEKYISMENITIIENTNYYIIEYYSRDTRSNNKVLYNNGEYITEFDAFGDLEEVYILK